MLQDYDQAIITFQKVLTITPDNQAAHRNLSHLYGLKGNYELQQFHDQKAKAID